MISLRVYKSPYTGQQLATMGYVPATRNIGCSKEVKDRYINREVIELIEKIEDSRGKLTESDKWFLYYRISPLYQNSERIKAEIHQELAESRKSTGNIAMTIQHRGPNTIAKPCPKKAQEMINLMGAIYRLVDRVFQPKQKADMDMVLQHRIPYKEQIV